MFDAVKPLQGWIEALSELFYPRNCLGCGAGVEEGSAFCRNCLPTLVRLEETICPRCSHPFAGAAAEPFVCVNCAGRRLYFECAVAAWRSRGQIRELVHRFKYGRDLALRGQLVEWLHDGWKDARLRERSFDFLTPVPLHRRRRRKRGFNQAEELARGLSERTGLPMKRVLRRIRHTRTQTALDRKERMENLRGSFKIVHDEAVKGSRILLIDDILTTGSTVNECARTLRAGGARMVCALTVARG